MSEKPEASATGRFDIAEVAASFPETATTLLVDRYLTNREAASARVFRVYKPTPPHYQPRATSIFTCFQVAARSG